jgi:anti-sigma regulatory factor (Ser/Thr protein kinase)
MAFMARLESLSEAVAFLTGDVPEEFSSLTPKVELIMEEFLVNVVTHAYKGEPGPLELRLRRVIFDGWPHLALKVVDWGPPFDPFEAEEPDLNASLEDKPIGGLGLHLVRNFAAHHSYRRDLESNEIEVWIRGPDQPK